MVGRTTPDQVGLGLWREKMKKETNKNDFLVFFL